MSIYEGFDSIKNIIVTNKRIRSNKLYQDILTVCYWADNMREAIYCLNNNIQSPPKCKLGWCNNDVSYKYGVGYKEFCCRSHALYDPQRQQIMKSDKTIEKRIKTNNERYGGNAPCSNKDILEKRKKTCREKYGFEYACQSETVKNKIKYMNTKTYGHPCVFSSNEIKKKILNTNNERYGVPNYASLKDCVDKRKKTMLERYGYETTLQIPHKLNQFREKMKDLYGGFTLESEILSKKVKDKMIEDYGVENCMQNHEIFTKAQQNSKKIKDYNAIDGRKIRIMGYEGYAYDWLTTNGKNVVECVKRNSVVYYDNNNKKRYYFPDLYDSNEDTLYEVKSLYILSKDYEKYFNVYDYVSCPLVFLVYTNKADKDTEPTVINNKEELKFYIEQHIKLED